MPSEDDGVCRFRDAHHPERGSCTRHAGHPGQHSYNSRWPYHYEPQALAEDLSWLLDGGASITEAAAQVGYAGRLDALAMRLHRAGMLDLARPIWRYREHERRSRAA